MLHFFHLYLAIGWILFACIHSIMASLWFKETMVLQMGAFYKYYRLVYSCIATLTLGAILIFQFSHQSFLLFHPTAFIIFPATLLTFAGLLVMLISGRKYLLAVSGAGAFQDRPKENTLEQGGLHHYVRHPVYSGTILTIWSLFLIFPFFSNLIACFIISLYTLIGIQLEEQKLIIEFGEHYKRYAEKTPKLVPFIRKRTG